MTYPDFFDSIPSIELTDPLSAVLGTFANGDVEISYLEVVKGAGHSCPTVGGAYLMTYHAIKALFPEERATRGAISIKMQDDLEEGTTGVVANVISYITGATDKSGFKGLAGNFARHSLMSYNQDVQNIRFTRNDTNQSVDIIYNPSSIAPDPKQGPLIQMILQGKANDEQKQEFGKLWQDRVKRIMVDNFDSKEVIQVVEV
jgi:hypothetical protein